MKLIFALPVFAVLIAGFPTGSSAKPSYGIHSETEKTGIREKRYLLDVFGQDYGGGYGGYGGYGGHHHGQGHGHGYGHHNHYGGGYGGGHYGGHGHHHHHHHG